MLCHDFVDDFVRKEDEGKDKCHNNQDFWREVPSEKENPRQTNTHDEQSAES